MARATTTLHFEAFTPIGAWKICTVRRIRSILKTNRYIRSLITRHRELLHTRLTIQPNTGLRMFRKSHGHEESLWNSRINLGRGTQRVHNVLDH
ncbi:usp36 protein [Moniliophthora roreri]|nr:usp36 protein [Moniliophthora roreri]